MPAPNKRSRSLRKIFVKTPRGTKIHYKYRKPKLAKCGKCGAKLKGVIRARPYRMKTICKTKKRPSRPYGGVLCSSCTRKLFIEKAKSL